MNIEKLKEGQRMIATQKRIDSKVFIEAVKRYPEIFDTSHPGFKQQDDKSGAWEKIASEFQTDADICKKKFRTLRERYTRELRRSYLEPNTPIKFEYFKQLGFLNPYIKFRSIMFETQTDTGKMVATKREDVSLDNKTDIKIVEDGYYEEEQEHEQQPEANEVNIIYETASGEQISDYTTSIQSSQINQINDQHIEEEMITVQPNTSKKRKTVDWDVDDDDNGDRYFSMSVASSLKRLSTISNLKAKVEIYQILEKYASKDKL